MSLTDLAFVSDQKGRACPKGSTRLADRDAERKAASRRDVEWRKAVWKASKYVCAFCGRKVRRTIELCAEQGQVDHIKPRSTSPALKFDPANGRILCAEHHRQLHAGMILP